MKTNSFINFTAGFATLMIAPAFAIEAPEDDAPPPPAADAHLAPQPAAEAKAPEPGVKAEVAFLGVVSSEVPEMLADHLGLKPGDGIIVKALMPDGPAAKAGVAVHDVITRVAGNPIGSSMDLTKEVKACKPGDSIHLDLIHQGKPVGLDVTLGTRPNEIAGLDPIPPAQLKLDGIPKDLADRVRGAIQGNLGGIELDFGNGAIGGAPQMEEAMREMKLRMEKAMQGLHAQEAGGIQPKLDVHQDATIRMMDEMGSIELKSNDGGKEVTIRDKDNKVTWNGPWDTEQDKAAAPDDIRKRVSRLNLDSKFQGNGLRLQLQGLDMPDE
jgi:serine protease Do